MFSLWNFFLKRKQFTAVLVAGLVALGAYCAIAIPKEASPAINVPVGSVSASFPGASAEDVESLITNPLEEQIVNIGNIDTLTSTSKDGSASIRVQFDADVNIDEAMQNLRDAVARVAPQLPSEVNAPSVSQANYNDRPILSVSVSGDLPQTELATLGQTLTNDLEAVPGVSEVDVSGIPVRETDIVVDKDALAAQGLTLTDVITAIADSNASLPAGDIDMSGVDYDVDFQGNITDPSQLGDVALANKNGTVIYLRDIALISDGLAPASTYSRVSVAGAPANQAMTLQIYEQTGANVVAVADAVKAEIASLQSADLKGMTVLIAPSTDQAVQVSTQLGALVKTGLITIALIIAILFLTIGWRESLVAALSIPLSFTIAFAGLYFLGYTLNLISLFALILAVGILVDSGIVITEAIHARMTLYGSIIEAARASLREYGWPLIAGTMTTVAVFIPLIFLSGTTGRFISNVPVTIIIVLLASIFVALAIVPLVATLFTNLKRNRLEKAQEEYTARARAWYMARLRRFLESRRAQNVFIAALVILFAAALALPLLGLIPTTFFPQTDQDYVYVNIQKPPGTALDQTDLTAREVEELLYQDKDIASFVTSVGASSSFGGASNSTAGGNQANITVNLYPGHTKSSTQIQGDIQKLLAPVKDASIQVLQPSSGPGSGAPIQIQFTGPNLDELVAAADASAQYLSTVPGATNITTTTKNNGTEFVLTIDRAKATALGLSEQEIAQTLRAAVNGTIATTIDQPLQNINVVVKLDLNPDYSDPSQTNQATMDAIENLSIQTPSGPVLLGSILSDSLGESNASISHLNEQRIETISAYPAANTTSGAVVAAFQKGLPSLHLPADVYVSYGGEAQSISQSFGQLFICLLVGLLAMFMILILAFDSVHNTVQLLIIIPLSLIGILVGLFLTRQTVSFPVFLGFVALAGVIVNHAIILTDSMVNKGRAEPTKPKIDVALEAASTRLRPILLTTATTVIGMVPLEIAGGEFAPLAFTIMFGLAFAICLTLVLLPTLFYRSELRKERRMSQKTQRRP